MILTMTPPEIDSNRWSKGMRDFVKVCLTKDPKLRPTAEELLLHPFLSSAENRQTGKLEL